MENNETYWYSQTLLTHQDKTYNSEGFIKLSLSTNTRDFINFNPVNFGIIISTTQNKFCNLNIQNATDLLLSFKSVLQNPGSIYSQGEFQILKRYNQNLNLIFDFVTESNSNEQVVRITIKSNETDFTKIIINFQLFYVIASRLKMFVNNYDTYCINLANLFLSRELLNVNKTLSGEIKNIPSQIMSYSSDTVHGARSEINKSVDIEESKVLETGNLIDDLDKFLGGQDMVNIEVSEIKEDKITKKESIQEINSKFVKDVLDNNLKNFENMLNTCSVEYSPITFLTERIETVYKQDNLDFKLLPNISEVDLKSMIYISKLLCTITKNMHVENDIPIPSSIPVLKYNVAQENILIENRELASDLLLFNGYLRFFRRRIESKISDSWTNKAVIYLIMRYYTDCFCFSFLSGKDINTLKSRIINRFKYYKSIGVFKNYEDDLKTHNCIDISENDISVFIDEVCEKIIDKTPSIDSFHNTLYNSGQIRIKSDNKNSLEQIINEIIPIEVSEKMGKDITDKQVIENIRSTYPISDETLEIFSKKNKVTKQKTQTINKTSNLHRFVKHFSDEIPENIRTEFISYIEILDKKKFDVSEINYAIEEFGENILKGLYLWNPDEDNKIAINYKYFFEKYENEIMTKDLIIAKMRNTEPTINTGEWDFDIN